MYPAFVEYDNDDDAQRAVDALGQGNDKRWTVQVARGRDNERRGGGGKGHRRSFSPRQPVSRTDSEPRRHHHRHRSPAYNYSPPRGRRYDSPPPGSRYDYPRTGRRYDSPPRSLRYDSPPRGRRYDAPPPPKRRYDSPRHRQRSPFDDRHISPPEYRDRGRSPRREGHRNKNTKRSPASPGRGQVANDHRPLSPPRSPGNGTGFW